MCIEWSGLATMASTPLAMKAWQKSRVHVMTPSSLRQCARAEVHSTVSYITILHVIISVHGWTSSCMIDNLAVSSSSPSWSHACVTKPCVCVTGQWSCYVDCMGSVLFITDSNSKRTYPTNSWHQRWFWLRWCLQTILLEITSAWGHYVLTPPPSPHHNDTWHSSLLRTVNLLLR